MQLDHEHQGIEGTCHFARESVYWPRISKDIEMMCKNCPNCHELQVKQLLEPMQTDERLAHPWVKLSTDLFQVDGQNFTRFTKFIYFSRYPIVKQFPRYISEDSYCGTEGNDRHVSDNWSGQWTPIPHGLLRLLPPVGNRTHNDQSQTRTVQWLH